MTTNERQPVRESVRLDDPLRFRGHKVYLTDEYDNEFYELWDRPTFEVSEQEQVHVVDSGEEGLLGLGLLAHRFYGRSDMWWVLATANDIDNPTRDVKPGRVLRIPAREKVLRGSL